MVQEGAWVEVQAEVQVLVREEGVGEVMAGEEVDRREAGPVEEPLVRMVARSAAEQSDSEVEATPDGDLRILGVSN